MKHSKREPEQKSGKKGNRTLAAGVIAGMLVFFLMRISPVIGQAVGPNDFIEELKLFSRAIGAVLEGYVGNVQPRPLLYQAVKGMLSSLDPYSQFIDVEHYDLLQIDMKGEYSGIGAALDLVDGVVTILDIQKDSAAERAGLLIQDKILKVDGVDMKGKAVADVASLLRGDVDTPVMLTILRAAVKKPFDVEVIRKKVEILAVNDIRIVGRAIGYMRIDNWQDHTAEQFDKALDTLTSKGMQALIIDLRNNGGGLMSVAIQLAERFLPKDTVIIHADSKIAVQRAEHRSTGEKMKTTCPLVVLVNERSASASEIFSAAIQDNHRGTIVGNKTFGKASIQSVIPLDEKTAMKLTTARYVSASGRVIDGVGIDPDVVLDDGPPGTPEGDQQVKKALDLLREYL